MAKFLIWRIRRPATEGSLLAPSAPQFQLRLKLQVSEILLAMGKVVTCYPQVGNGIQFIRMLPDDREQLRQFIETVEKELAEKT